MTAPSAHTGHVPAGAHARELRISGWLTGIYFFIELGIGFWTGSISVISDAFHTFSAVGGIVIALVAGHLAKQEADERQTFGLIRAEIIGALFNGLFLTGMAVLVLYMGAMRLLDPMHLASGPMLLVALGGLVTEIISIGLLYKGQKGNLNVRGAFWHVLQTFVGSFIIIISAIVIRFTDFMAIDPLLGMAFGLVLFWGSWSIIKSALDILLQRTPADVDLPKVIAALKAVPDVKNLHHIHAWVLSSGKNVFSSHICIADLSKSDVLLKEMHDMLRDQFGFYFSTIQLEEECLDEEPAKEIDITAPLPSHHS